jgi:UDP-glucose 4-epimerase
VRDYFYIDDLIAAIISAASSDITHERVFNIGGGRGYSLCQLIQVIEEVTGRRAVVDYQAGRRFDVPEMVLDTSRAATYLNWAPRVELPEGVARTWQWILGLGELDS